MKSKKKSTDTRCRVCVQLPQAWGMALRELAKANLRPATNELMAALEPRLKAAGIPVPKQ